VTDIPIRDVPDDVIAAIDANAHRSGISRSEYLLRILAREHDAHTSKPGTRVRSLEIFAERIRDIDNPEVMRQAWS
jgi:hypothetical protein